MFFFFWIIKNLFPKGQCPTNNQTRRRFPEKPTNGHDLPYKRASSRYKINHEQAHTPGICYTTKARPPKQGTKQPNQLKQTYTPEKGETNPAHIPGSGSKDTQIIKPTTGHKQQLTKGNHTNHTQSTINYAKNMPNRANQNDHKPTMDPL